MLQAEGEERALVRVGAQEAWHPGADVVTGLAVARFAVGAPLAGEAKPRNPRHFEITEGGRKRVLDTFIDKNKVLCI